MTTIPTICRCNFCSGEIEFEPSRAGEIVTCPHCASDTQLYFPGGAQQVQPPKPPRESSEQTYYHADGIMVTNRRFVVRSKTYALSGITSVELETAKVSILGPLILALGGVFLIVSPLVREVRIMGGAMILLAAWKIFKRIRPVYFVTIATTGGETHALSTRNYEEVSGIVTALNEAILSRG